MYIIFMATYNTRKQQQLRGWLNQKGLLNRPRWLGRIFQERDTEETSYKPYGDSGARLRQIVDETPAVELLPQQRCTQ